VIDLLLAWIAFPAALLAICLGCGLALEALLSVRMPGILLPACGLAAVVVVGQFLTLADATAELTTPVAAAAAVLGFGFAWLKHRPIVAPRALVLALIAVFAVYAAPIVLSGDPTLAGYIKLDDTATWLAFTDHVMEHGRDLDSLAPSTYEATLAVNIGGGYPVGAFIPLGVVSQLLALDPSLSIQPFMACMGVLLAAALWALAAPLVRPARLRAVLIFVAAQPALLFGYYLWGGVKEVMAAALIATTAALSAWAVSRGGDWRSLGGLALTTGAVVGVLSVGALAWLGPLLLVPPALIWKGVETRALAERAAAVAAAVLVLALPVIGPGGLLPPTSAPLSDSQAKGNLIEPLDALQASGIWPAGDFRLPPDAEPLSYVLIAVALMLAVIGIVEAWRRRAVGVMCLVVGGVVGTLALTLPGSPWVDGKALATASPFVLFVALLGVAVLAELRPRWPAIVLGAAVGIGVLWSTALAYRDVSLAPYEQFSELEEIGDLVAGEGPTLMTEYSPYGARHFLRESDPESVSELRRREIPRRDGSTVEKGMSADTDELDPGALATYRTLVLRRSPATSRPPAEYELVWSGDDYEVWQRPDGSATLAPRLPLGTATGPTAVPRCEAVLALAERGERLLAAGRPRPLVVSLGTTDHPAAWEVPGLPETPAPAGAGSIVADVDVQREGDYEVWLGGSVRPSVDLLVDGREVGSVRHELNNQGQYVTLGSAALERGGHQVEVRFSGSDLHPGSGGQAVPVGPLVLSEADAADSRLVTVPAGDARELCGRPWDWIELS
jgi:hypothetical protein